ncbi:DnaJ domain-containing protein [Gilvimarinus agarilyticus]|uniref:DNA-J related domain-containing protein n=1 Tax=Gilvimarinus sp. 2_MG-2023 TaxID=3062666 RepID=UPI001C087316|nr:DNA-J related domain-containing protein [Gilvimarinus sp. 2_MG-2023]MBU2885054.1 DnaJ domain-containing protein [Gilvimarinus agarilyticus]MDO6569951.1 DNA-J related domain-containing protein [Gilvimarinus sp. 2_MG-2023]
MATLLTQNCAHRPNPLLEMLRQLLFESGQQYTEHALLKIAVARGLVPENYGTCPKQLFQAHFALFNGLYRLQEELAGQRLFLDIGLMQVDVRPWQGPSDSTQLDGGREGKLRDYYFDWRHFDEATVASVNELLDDFWQNLGRQPVATAERSRALHIMGLAEPVSWSAIKQRYRRLAMQHHPDRGGDADQLQEVHWAMSVLERVHLC